MSSIFEQSSIFSLSKKTVFGKYHFNFATTYLVPKYHNIIFNVKDVMNINFTNRSLQVTVYLARSRIA